MTARSDEFHEQSPQRANIVDHYTYKSGQTIPVVICEVRMNHEWTSHDVLRLLHFMKFSPTSKNWTELHKSQHVIHVAQQN